MSKKNKKKSFFFTTQNTVVNVPEVIFVCRISRFRIRGLFCVKYLTLFGYIGFKRSTFFVVTPSIDVKLEKQRTR